MVAYPGNKVIVMDLFKNSTCTCYNCLTNRATERSCLRIISEIKSLLCYALALSLSEKAMAPHFSTLAWKIPWREEPGGLQSMGLQRVGHDWATSLSHFHCPCWFLTQVSSMTSKLFFGFYLQIPLSHSPQLLFQTLEFSLNPLSLKISPWSVSGRHGWLVTILVMSYNCFKLEKLTLIY